MKLSLSALMGTLSVALACGLSGQALAKQPVKRPLAKAASAQKVAKGAAAAGAPTRRVVAKVSGKRLPVAGSANRRHAVVAAAATAAAVPASSSFGQMQGLHASTDPLALRSSVALVVDQDTNEVLFSKNSSAVLPIASITKLMTGLVVTEAHLPLDETLTITQDDIDTEKGSRSRLTVGAQLSRGDMMHLALMSSENRAANALGRHFPGGLEAFVAAMNRKAAQLGMKDTVYVEPTGLSSRNQSSARDLAVLVKEAHKHPLLRELTTSPEAQVAVGHRVVNFHTTNRLVTNPNWEIGLQKTGYISEAGRCLVMQAHLAGRKLIMVLLDSAGKYSRLGDAERIRRWLDQSAAQAAAGAHRPG